MVFIIIVVVVVVVVFSSLSRIQRCCSQGSRLGERIKSFMYIINTFVQELEPISLSYYHVLACGSTNFEKYSEIPTDCFLQTIDNAIIH